MIEVSAKLLGGPVYFSGEKISCRVIFNVTPQLEDVQNSCTSNRNSIGEILGWASAQVVCICSINPQKIVVIDNTSKQSNHQVSFSTNITSLSPSRGERGVVIFSTNPKILVCDLKLSKDTCMEYIYEEILPNDLPPSFRGQAVKYSYKIKIGLQRVGAPVKLIHVPLRVMICQTIDVAYSQQQQEILVSNPFLKVNHPVASELDGALEAMQLLTSKRSSSIYKVTNSKGKVVSLCLFKTGYRLGEDIIGTLDFIHSKVSCMQYSVTLQSQEIVPEEKRQKGLPIQSNKLLDETVVTSYTKHHEFCVGYCQTHLNLPVPLHITPTFETELVTLKWRLHFEFVTTLAPVNWEGETIWNPPNVLDIETMVWDLPIVIYPTTPAHVSKGLYGEHEARMVL